MFGPLLFENETSDCRDHCANERSMFPSLAVQRGARRPFALVVSYNADIDSTAFLSYLRLSIYMAIVSVAIVLSFHLRKTATDRELRMATPLGVIFLALSVSCLGVGLANYIGIYLLFLPTTRVCISDNAPN